MNSSIHLHMTPVLPEDSSLQYRGRVVFMGRLSTYYWLGFMDNVWNVESIAFWDGKPKQSIAVANTIFGLTPWKARAVYGHSEHNLWTSEVIYVTEVAKQPNNQGPMPLN